jgi:acyl dehydratase
VKVGDTRVDEAAPITLTQLVQYSGASGDFAIVHHDEAAARSLGYPGAFAHGMLTMAIAGQTVGDWVGIDGVREFGVRFTRPVWLGDRLRTTVAVVSVWGEVAELSVITTNQAGETVLSGSAKVIGSKVAS